MLGRPLRVPRMPPRLSEMTEGQDRGRSGQKRGAGLDLGVNVSRSSPSATPVALMRGLEELERWPAPGRKAIASPATLTPSPSPPKALKPAIKKSAMVFEALHGAAHSSIGAVLKECRARGSSLPTGFYTAFRPRRGCRVSLSTPASKEGAHRHVHFAETVQIFVIPARRLARSV